MQLNDGMINIFIIGYDVDGSAGSESRRLQSG
jgi:hypothetical protein